MKFKNILLALTVCIIALGCKKQDLLIYDSEIAGVYFQALTPLPPGYKGNIQFSDSLYYSFAAGKSTTKDTILRARIQTLGKLRDYARPFKVSLDQANSTAVEGKHFEIDLSSAVVPAGASEAFIRVKLKRTDDMLKQKFRLALKLEDNEHFKVYMQKQSSDNGYAGSKINADRWTFIVDDILTKPDSWRFFASEYWGQSWSVKKYTFINSVLGWTHYDWTAGWVVNKPPSYSPVQVKDMGSAAARVRDSLQVLKNAGTPLLDEDGTPMQLSVLLPLR